MKIYQLSDRPLLLGAPAYFGPYRGTLVLHQERRTAEFLRDDGASCADEKEASETMRVDFWRFLLLFRARLSLLNDIRALCARCDVLRPLAVFGVDGVCFFCAPVPVVRCPACGKKIHRDRLVLDEKQEPLACAWCDELRLRPGVESACFYEPQIKRRRGRPRKHPKQS